MIDIKNINNELIFSAPVTDKAVYRKELMKEEFVRLGFNHHSLINLPEGAYIEYNGERFYLMEPYTPTRTNELEYTYEPQFCSEIMLWKKLPLFFMDNDLKNLETDWSITDTIEKIAIAIGRSIKKFIGIDFIKDEIHTNILVDSSLAGFKSFTFQGESIFNGLNKIAQEWETEWWIEKRDGEYYLHLSTCKYGDDPVELEVGRNINLPSVRESSNDYYNRFYIYGSTRNITQDYDDGSVIKNHIVQKRLTLPNDLYPDGYIDAKENLSSEEVRATTLVFDDIYPSSNLAIGVVGDSEKGNGVWAVEKEEYGGDSTVTRTYHIYYIKLKEIEGEGVEKEYIFNPEDEIPEKKISINFQTGALSGYEFELNYYNKITITPVGGGSVELTNVFEILFDESSGHIIPNQYLIPGVENKVILFNIEMPEGYITSARERLKQAGLEEIERRMSDRKEYSFDSNPVAFSQDNTDLNVGQAVLYKDNDKTLLTRVLTVEKKIDYPIQQNITIGEERIQSNTQQLKEEVSYVNQNLNFINSVNDLSKDIQNAYGRTQKLIAENLAKIGHMWTVSDQGGSNERITTPYPVHISTSLIVDGINVGTILKLFECQYDTDGKIIALGSKVHLYSRGDVSAFGSSSGGGGGGEGGASNLYELLDVNRGVQTAPAGSLLAKGSDGFWSYIAQSAIVPDLTGYATQSWVNTQAFLKSITKSMVEGVLTGSISTHTHAFSSITGTPTTLSGYGITNAYTKTAVDNLLTPISILINSHVADSSVHITPAERTLWNNLSNWFGYDSAKKAVYVKQQNGEDIHFFAYGDISAFGSSSGSSGGSGGASNLYELLDVNRGVQTAPAGSLLSKGSDGLWTYIAQSAIVPNLTGYATQSWVNSQGFLKSITKAMVENVLTGTISSHNHTFASLTSKPTTLSGYGITDAYTKTETQSWVNSQGFLKSVTKAMVEGVLTGSISSHSHTWDNITGKPSTFTPSAHTHAISDVTGLSTELGKYVTLAGTQTISGEKTFSNPVRYASGVESTTMSSSFVIDTSSASWARGLYIKHNGTTLAVFGAHGGVGTLNYAYIGSGYSASDTWFTITPTATTIKTALSVTGNITGASGNGAFLQLGNIRLVYDSANNAIKVAKSDGTAANIYATGDVSAFGSSSGGSGGGSGIIQTVYSYADLGRTFNNSTLTDTFNAYTINAINSDLQSLKSNVPLTFATTGSGNAVTAVSKSGNTVTVTKGSTFLTGITKALVEGVLTGSISSHTHTFASITSKPTTLSGYGITDVYTKTEIASQLGNYVTLNTTQTITGEKTFGTLRTTGIIYAGSSILTGGKTSSTDGLAGFALAGGSGLFHIQGASPEMRFYLGGVTSYTSRILESYAGILSVPGKLAVGVNQTSASTHALTINGTVAGSSTIQGTRFISTQATGTAPLTVASTTVVPNLNADMLDGLHSTDLAKGAYVTFSSGTTQGWKRIGYTTNTPANNRLHGLFSISNSYSGNRNISMQFVISGSYQGADAYCDIVQLGGYATPFNQVRMVIGNTTTTSPGAYLEVYYNGSTTSANTIYISASNVSTGFYLYSTWQEGSVPDGYTAYTKQFRNKSISGWRGYFDDNLTVVGTATTGAINASGAITGSDAITASGIITGNKLVLTNTAGEAHMQFSRGAANYITAPASGIIGFITNGKALAANNIDLCIRDGFISPYASGQSTLGSTSYRWGGVYSTTGDFSSTIYGGGGVLSGGKKTSTDGVAGIVMGNSGVLHIVASAPDIRFYFGLATDYTSRIYEGTSGRLTHTAVSYFANATDATSATSYASIRTAGGLAVAKTIWGANVYATGVVSGLAVGTSDMRLKTDIKEFSGLDTMKKIGMAFMHKWNDKALSLNNHLSNKNYNHSWSAQKFEKELPQYTLHGLYGKDYLGINRDGLLPIVWNGVLETESKVTKLEKRVKQLENELKELRRI